MIAIKDQKTGHIIIRCETPKETATIISGITYMIVDGNPTLGEIISIAVTLAPIEVLQDLLKTYKEKRPNRAKDIELTGNMLLALKSTIETR